MHNAAAAAAIASHLQEGDAEAAEAVLMHAWAALDANVHKQVGRWELPNMRSGGSASGWGVCQV